MKIEMCESLLQSYLKYIKRCRLTQTNWKVSFLADQMSNAKKEALEETYETYKELFYSDNVKREQYLKQAEADIVGYDFKGSHLYLFDTAFHEKGLGYTSGGKRNNVPVVLKKCFRNALLGLYYFENIKAVTVGFATPKINEKDKNEIDEKLAEMQNILQESHSETVINISLIANSEFQREILQKTLFESKSIADTSDLFIRSAKLMALFEKGKLLNDKIINNQNELDAKEESNEDDDIKASAGNILYFYPNQSEFEQCALLSGKYFLAGINAQNMMVNTYEFNLENKEYKSSLRSRILSKNELREKNRGSIVRFIAYVKKENEKAALVATKGV